jgi:hypothetical protein
MEFKKALQSSRSICLLLMIAILAGMLFGFKPLLFLEYTGTPVAIVAIDDKSLKNIGDWPWPRSYIADIINTLSKNGAHTQGVSILYRSRELNDGLSKYKTLERTSIKNPRSAKSRR